MARACVVLSSDVSPCNGSLYRNKVWDADRTLSMESGVSHAKDHLCKDAYDSITGNATGEYRG